MGVLTYALTSLTKVKNYLGIAAGVSTYDTVLEYLIDSVTLWIEGECGGRRLFDGATEVTEYYDGDDGTGKSKIFLKRYPVQSITSVSYNSGTSGTPTWTAFDADDYERDDNEGVLHFLSSLPKGRQNIKVKYKSGYVTTIPQDLDVACCKMVAKEFDKRKSQGVLSESVGGGSVSWNENVDPSVLSVIRKYRRFI